MSAPAVPAGDLKERQQLLAGYLDDPELEAKVRADPDGCAAAFGVKVAFARWLAQLEPRRVAAFRRSRTYKDARRRGE